jgi:DNA-binding response OmpR family regulator
MVSTHAIRRSASHWEVRREIHFGEREDAASAILVRKVRSAGRNELPARSRDAAHLLRSQLLRSSLRKRRPASRQSGNSIIEQPGLWRRVRTVRGKDITMKTHGSADQTADRIDTALIGTDSKISRPRSASIRLLNSSTKAGRERGNVRSRPVLQKSQNEMAELQTVVDGLPILVRLLIRDIPAEMRSDLVSRGDDIHSLLSSTLEKVVDRIRGSSLRSDAPSKQPIAIVELISSGERLARLPAPPNETVLRVGPLELDLLDRAAKRGDRKIDLRPREFKLLKYMMQRSDNLLTRATLLKEVWRYRFVPETNLVDVHMGRLRRKVDGANEPPMIRNVRGVGFVLSAGPCSLSSPPKPAERSASPTVADKSPRSLERAVA